jgi:tetratricopeptide (TPR) repeat protein
MESIIPSVGMLSTIEKSKRGLRTIFLIISVLILGDNCFGQAAIEYLNSGIAKGKLDDFKGAIADYDKAIEINPNYGEAYGYRGYAKVNLNNYQGAIADFNKAIEINIKYAKAYFFRGISKYNLSDYQGAIADYNKAIKINPKYQEAYYFRGILKDELSDYHEAITDFNKAIEINPTDEEAYFNRGIAKYSIDDYSGAVADYSKAIEINPTDENEYYNRGIARYYLRDYQGALEDYSKAIEINPTDEKEYYNRGEVKFNLDDYSGAVADYSKTIEINPKYGEAYDNRGLAKVKLNDYDGAIADYSIAIEINPKNAEAYANRGYAKVKLNDNQGALADFNKAIEINPISAEAYFSRGMAKFNLNDPKGGLADFNKGQEINHNKEINHKYTFNDFINFIPILFPIALAVLALYVFYREQVKKNKKLEKEINDRQVNYKENLSKDVESALYWERSKIEQELSKKLYERYEYTSEISFYDENNRCERKKIEKSNHKPFQVAEPLKEIITYEYLKGLLCLEKVFKPDMFTNEIDLKTKNYERIRYEYNKNKQCILEEHYDSDNILTFHEANEYDSRGNCIKNKRNSKGDWTIITYSKYDNINLCIEEICHSNQIGYVNSKNQFEYNQEGNCIKQIYTNLMKFSDDFNKTTEYRYEYENNKCVREFEIVEGDIIDNKKLLQAYTYDNHGNCIKELDYRNDKGLRSRIYRTFNDDNEVNLIIREEGTSIKIENFQRKKLTEV